MNKYFFIILFYVAVFQSSTAQSKDNKPNVIIITIDNHNTSVLGFAGNILLETPNIDRLSSHGVFLSNYHCASRCTASRSAVMTGRYHIRNGAIGTGDAREIMGALDRPIIANIFKNAGYKTALFGKWHLGNNYPFRPEDRGFQEVVSFKKSSTVFHSMDGQGKISKKHKFRHNTVWEEFDGFRTDVWFNQLSGFMKKNVDQPFFAYLATCSTHFRNLGLPEITEKYKKKYEKLNKSIVFSDNMMEDVFIQLASEMESIDLNIGKMLSELKQLGISNNTIIVYTSDGYGGASPKELMRPNSPMYTSECPAIIYWPDGKLSYMKDVKELVANIDLAPTLLDMCGIEEPEGIEFDGRSVYPLLNGTKSNLNNRIYIQDHQSIVPKDRRVILRPLQKTTIYLPEGSVEYSKGIVKGDVDPQLLSKAENVWFNWWNKASSEFQSNQYIIVGSEFENPSYIGDVYTETSGMGGKMKYVFALEFADNGEYVFSNMKGDPSQNTLKYAEENNKIGYVEIDNKKFEGKFPMKLSVDAGQKMVRVSFDGILFENSVKVERIEK